MGGRWRYKLLVSLNFTNCAKQQNSGWTLALQASSVLKLYKLYNADISEFVGGRWRYKLLVSLDCTNRTMLTYQNSWVDVGVTNV